MLKQSFQINEKGLISLTGLKLSSIELINQIHFHQAIKDTFLRHNQFFKSGKQVSEKLIIDSIEGSLKYKQIQWYAHQTFAKQLCAETGELLTNDIPIVSWLYLGATVRHAKLSQYTKLVEKSEYALALLFLPVACQYFIRHSDSLKRDKKQPIPDLIVVPEVDNFATSAQRCWNLSSLNYLDFHVINLGEAALIYYSSDLLKNKYNYQQKCQVWLYQKKYQRC